MSIKNTHPVTTDTISLSFRHFPLESGNGISAEICLSVPSKGRVYFGFLCLMFLEPPANWPLLTSFKSSSLPPLAPRLWDLPGGVFTTLSLSCPSAPALPPALASTCPLHACFPGLILAPREPGLCFMLLFCTYKP